ncbi:PREDICTED: cytochrome P450 71B19-like [Tarenaya hassleriana]|uniref:cytochrome P450 71B19-like n=1 Tax=Tarenaya hassleriana TaxID=28532 RepID=UPI00053C66E1|nr:PREDICTED: cytochrome P450 71B19-like [Tarenaya hassleriana]
MAVLLSFLWLLLPALLSFFFIKKIRQSKLKLPPSPPQLPIIGNLHQLGDSDLPHRSLAVLSKKYGPVMLLRFGFAPVVVISSSEGAEAVLKTHDLECCTRPKLFGTRKLSHGYRDIGVSPYGEGWRERRKLAVREVFSVKKVQSFMGIREEECNLLVKELTESASKQSTVNLSKTLLWYSASIIFKAAFGQDFHTSKIIDKNRMEDLIFEAETVFASLSYSDFFPGGVGWMIDWLKGQHKRMDEIFVEMNTFFQKVIDEHLKPERSTKDQRDVIDAMLEMVQSHGKDRSSNFSELNIKAVSVNLFLAGIDTSAITMVWVMTELVRKPALMKKVQDEIRKCIGENKEMITQEDVDKVHYLKLVIKETLRLHPPAPMLLPRETMSQIKIQGYDIPANTRLQINTWAIGRDPKYWTNPDEFNPDRFVDNPVDNKGQHFQLLSFGSGRRMCPGMNLGMANVEWALVNLLYFFDWKLPQGMAVEDIDLEEAGTLTVIKKVPLELVPVLRH